MNIIFVAGGLGTRFKELSVFPKILLPTATHNSILEESISRFGEDNNFYVIINSKFYNMVNNYIEVNQLRNKIGTNSLKVIETNLYDGSLSSLADVYYQIPHINCLFVWSDIVLPKNDETLENTISSMLVKDGPINIVFTSTHKGYRYNFDNNIVEERKNYDGNVPGVYYFYGLPDFSEEYLKLMSKENCDLIDYIQHDINENNAKYVGVELDRIVEYKDLETYKDLLKSHKVDLSQTRFFNKIIIDKDNKTVTKAATNKEYFQIIKDEKTWYKKINELVGNGVISPRIYLFNYKYDESFVMEYLDNYIPLHVFNDNESKENIIKAYNGIQNNINTLREHFIYVSQEIFKADLKKELKTKVIDRCDKISNMLINYNKEYLSELLDNVINNVLSYYKDTEKIKYTLCHGDLNGSNVMVNKDNPEDVKFIDPRGYFGYTKLYGWDAYEYSKLLYGLSGYDDFNLNPQIYTVDWPKNHKYKADIDYLKKPLYNLIVGVIYVALAGYISQDIMKANIAYEYGIKLINEVI